MSTPKVDPITFEDVGGLGEQIQAIKEMMLFPIMYKELLAKFNMRTPRGVLFFGPPGTGKTLLASALANECNIGEKPVSFFGHKGADILGSYVGESENRLRDVFAKARRNSPSIIFFDEIDALAPSRENLTRGNHVHASVVSVLLTEMDGLDSAGDIFVIGATNRLDAIDPALRRPGRFDRELRFALPNSEERKQILKVHTSKWRPRISDDLLSRLARETRGHCGADLCAMCSEAFMCCVRRTHPEAASCEQKERIHKSLLQVSADDFDRARSKYVPSAYRSSVAVAKCLPRMIEPLFSDTLNLVIAGLRERWPVSYLHGSKFPQQSNKVFLKGPRLLLTGPAEHMHTCHLAPAILNHFEHLPVVTIDIVTLFSDSAQSTESACTKAITKARTELPCVLYLPDVTHWWKYVEDTTRGIFTSHIQGFSANTPILILMTSHQGFADMPLELQGLFVEAKDVVNIEVPSEAQREAFFGPLLLDVPNNMKASTSALTATSTSTTKSGNSDRSGGDCLDLRGRAVKRPAPEPAGPSSKMARKSQAPCDDASAEGSLELSDKWRRKLLERLVGATQGFVHQSLERVYEDLSACCARWLRHQSNHQLKTELFESVTAIEVAAASSRNDQ